MGINNLLGKLNYIIKYHIVYEYFLSKQKHKKIVIPIF